MNRSWNVPLFIFSFVISIFPLCAQTESTNAINQLTAEIDSKLQPASAHYETSLDKAFTDYKSSGKLGEAIIARDLMRSFRLSRRIDQKDIVPQPADVRDIQLKYLAEKKSVQEGVLAPFVAERRLAAAQLVAEGKLEQAAQIERLVSDIKRSFAYVDIAEAQAGGAGMPKGIRITREHKFSVNVLGQLNSEARLVPGEKYDLIGVIGTDVIISVGTNRVQLATDQTDFPLRVERLVKGLPEEPPAGEKDEVEEGDRGSTVAAIGLVLGFPDAVVGVTSFPGASAVQSQDGYRIGRRGGVTLRKNHPQKVMITLIIRGGNKGSSFVVCGCCI